LPHSGITGRVTTNKESPVSEPKKLLPNPGGGVIDADALHWASLAALGGRFAVIAPNAAAIVDG